MDSKHNILKMEQLLVLLSKNQEFSEQEDNLSKMIRKYSNKNKILNTLSNDDLMNVSGGQKNDCLPADDNK